ncbi:MAG: hypothetical protein M3Z46_01885, partial [Actinomycetota bacterium]|nr:hypothetical protein [Actinomycetota bacterium]
MPTERAGGEVLGAVPERDGTPGNWLFWVAVGLALLPLLVSAVHVLGEGNFPNLGDIAGIELRTRDVGHHPVLLGLWSRNDWNHPGPALFYLLALPYRLTGSKPAGLQLGALLINGAAVVGMAVVARRRGGLALSLMILLGCGVLLRALRPEYWSNPWNPFTPALPFGLLVLLCWSVMCDDVWALPVAAGVASFCVQTHIGYAPVAVPLLAIAAAWLAIRARRAVRRVSIEPQRRRDVARASILTAVVVGIMWLPPVADQLLHRPGNVIRIMRYFGNPHAHLATLADGLRVVGGQFGLRPTWATGNDKLTSTLEPALVHTSPLPLLLVPLVLAGVVFWRRRSFEAAALVATLMLTAALGVVAVERTVVPVFDYRLRWTWVLGMLAAVSIAWAVWQSVVPRYRKLEHRCLVPLAVVGLSTLGVVNMTSAVHAARPWRPEEPVLSTLLHRTVAALPRGHGDVVVHTADKPAIFYQGVMLALERRGIPVRTDDPIDIVGNGSDHRVHRRGPVRATLTVA